MRKVLVIAAVAVTALTLAIGGASAARTAPTAPPPPSTPNNGNSGVCTVLCFKVPVKPRLSESQLKLCSDRLAQLGRVTISEIARVNDGHKVHVVPICDTVTNHSLTEPQQAYLSRGNIQGLLPAIAQNVTLVGKLQQSGYRTGDVLGVQYTSYATLLYVSHR